MRDTRLGCARRQRGRSAQPPALVPIPVHPACSRVRCASARRQQPLPAALWRVLHRLLRPPWPAEPHKPPKHAEGRDAAPRRARQRRRVRPAPPSAAAPGADTTARASLPRPPARPGRFPGVHCPRPGPYAPRSPREGARARHRAAAAAMALASHVVPSSGRGVQCSASHAEASRRRARPPRRAQRSPGRFQQQAPSLPPRAQRGAVTGRGGGKAASATPRDREAVRRAAPRPPPAPARARAPRPRARRSWRGALQCAAPWLVGSGSGAWRPDPACCSVARV